ncbi:sensor histidine kinase [Geomicrobium sp. JCM 19037]|uniref:cache domain-containing sensor histidine kinase n=1 Tax=Geomicrobium sp. JCM 19037 TaxID=1460634 RepID=UPI0005A5E970|nr:sensor histidine kinase [Geomicrobium sp. JCM 19037]
MFRFLLNMSLQNKLLILVILTSIIPITLLATFTYQNSIQVMEEQLSRAEEDKLTQVNKQLSFFFSDMDQMSLYLYRNDMVQRVLAEPETRSHTKKYEDYLAVNDLFDTMTSSMNWTLNLYIIGLNGDRYFTGDYLPRQYDQYMEGWGIFRKANEAKGHLVWNTHQSINHPQGDDIALTGGRLLKDITSGEVLGYLVIDVMNQTMLDLYADTTHEDGHMYLLDGQDYIVSSQPTNKVKGEKFSLDSFNHKDMEGGFVQYVTEEESYVIVHNENEKHDFSFVSMVPDVEVRKLADEFLTLTVVIAVVALIIFSWAAYFLSKTLTRPLYELMELLRRFANGDHTVRFTRNYNDDIGRLGNNFNQMAHKVNHLIKEDYEKEMLLKESELKALQAQINPHFLYNTLETVNWMARMNGVKQISDVVVSLGGMMRYTISRGDNLVPLEDELTQLNHYLTIQKVRYKDKFDVEIDVDQSAWQC